MKDLLKYKSRFAKKKGRKFLACSDMLLYI